MCCGIVQWDIKRFTRLSDAVKYGIAVCKEGFTGCFA